MPIHNCIPNQSLVKPSMKSYSDHNEMKYKHINLQSRKLSDLLEKKEKKPSSTVDVINKPLFESVELWLEIFFNSSPLLFFSSYMQKGNFRQYITTNTIVEPFI